MALTEKQQSEIKASLLADGSLPDVGRDMILDQQTGEFREMTAAEKKEHEGSVSVSNYREGVKASGQPEPPRETVTTGDAPTEAVASDDIAAAAAKRAKS